jgi:hypothetical protein
MTGTATNVDATAVNTIDWLSAGPTIVVPVYQRQYRWDIGGCEQLLADIRAVADADEQQRHFLGSILSSTSNGEGADELVLIDGQQRITTIMLLVAALHHTVRDGDPEFAAELERVLVRGTDPVRTTLRPHRGWAEIFESVVLDSRPDGQERDSRFDDNYAFFRSQVPAGEAERIWRGLQRLEHVAIGLGSHANAQQIFESLNSTGEPLRDHELIHNYVLMGLSHAEQNELEEEFWEPLERNTGESIADFWRHYLILATGLEVDVAGGRGVYDAFRRSFPRLDRGNLRELAAEWREYSEIYAVLLEPERAPSAELRRQLAFVSTFGRGMHPLLLRAYRDLLHGAVDERTLVRTLEHVQSLLLRRAIVGVTTERLVARLCRAREEGPESLVRAIARITPSDERVRVALKYGALPHAAYVLGRLAGEASGEGLDVEHVLPLAPGDAWSADGIREWSELSEDEQNSHRALAQTLGNLALLEPPLAERALDLSFPEKAEQCYARSSVALTRELADLPAWSTSAISERTARLTTDVLRIWAAPATVLIDDDGLTPVLDAQRRRGWPPGWNREFDYVEYRGEHWEVHDVKHLFNRIVKRLWAEDRETVVAFSARRGGPIFPAQAWNGHWDALDDTHFLYMGWDSRYMLEAVQSLLQDAGIAPEVFVKYSYIGEVM